MKHFLRIDDIGLWQYQLSSINQLMEICAEKNTKLVLSVITDQLENETVEYIKEYAASHKDMLELLFHGHTHDLKEFSSGRNHTEQFDVLHTGIKVFEGCFGVKPKGFVPPEHICTSDTITALDEAGFEFISKQFKPTFDGLVFYTIGKLLRRWFIAGKKISYHPGRVAHTSLDEISISIELAEKSIIKSVDRLKQEYEKASTYTKSIGFLIHPQVLEIESNVSKFYQFLEHAEHAGWEFEHISEPYNG